MNTKIRKAKQEDKDQIAVVFADENSHHYKLQPEIFNDLSSNEILPDDWFESIIKSEQKHIFVAENKNGIVGLVLLAILETPDDPLFKERKWIYIEELTVLSNYRGQNIGKKLLDFIDNYAKEIKADSIRLEVWENNEGAVRFYKKNGFQIKKHIMWKEWN